MGVLGQAPCHRALDWTGLEWGFWFWGVILYSSSQGLAVLWAGGTSGLSESTTLNIPQERHLGHGHFQGRPWPGSCSPGFDPVVA